MKRNADGVTKAAMNSDMESAAVISAGNATGIAAGLAPWRAAGGIRLRKLGFFLLVLAIVAFSVFPFVVAVSTSLTPSAEIFSDQLAPHWGDASAYAEVFSDQPFATNILNSLLVCSAVVVVALALSLMAAYAFARVPFRGRELLLSTILGVSLFPQVAILSGMFELVSALGLYNSLGALVLSYLVFILPFTVWLITTFLKEVPVEIEEAAIVDGASTLDIIWRVHLPLLRPAIATTALLSFIAAWNEFLYALTFTLSTGKRTVPVAIALISGASAHELPWGQIMAASVIVTLPVVALVLVFQRQIVAGLTAGAVKG